MTANMSDQLVAVGIDTGMERSAVALQFSDGREASVPMAALHKACEFLSSGWDCPFVHFGNIPCLKGLPADGPGSCQMTDENIAECWELYSTERGGHGD